MKTMDLERVRMILDHAAFIVDVAIKFDEGNETRNHHLEYANTYLKRQLEELEHKALFDLEQVITKGK